MDRSLYSQIYEIEDTYWWAVGTRAIFREWLAAALPAGPRLLDLGCGCGAFLAELGGLGTGFGVDLVFDAVAHAHRRGLERLSVARAEALPYATGTFDAVTALDVVEHVEAEAATLAEIARVLRPGGLALIHVPAFPVLWSEHDVVAHPQRRYRRAELHRAVAAAGLSIRRESYVNVAIFPLAATLRLAKRALGLPRGNRPPALEVYELPRWLNRALIRLLDLERVAMRWVRLPVGVSLLCLAQKPAETR